MTLQELLAARGLRQALIIDDAFDDVPKAEDLSEAIWSIFFDDLIEADAKVLREAYPDFERTERENLQSSDAFVAAMWNQRGKLSEKARDGLFADYERINQAERKKLDELGRALAALGLECKAIGRELSDEARNADIIFIDLFLGQAQTDEVMRLAVDRVKLLVRDRVASPPLVILMSRSGRLNEKRNEFRDEAQLLGSMFRVVSKARLEEEGVLDQLLLRLATHYEDARRVAAFVDAWDKGLAGARERFVKGVRRLDLSDFAQIQALLLEFEGQSLGEYLLDVCDGVLQYEIEADAGTIAAAQELNKIDLKKYPAPHLTGTSDLQELLHRMVFQHRERRKLSPADSLQFGDLLRWRDPEKNVATPSVSLVVTPACDLTRDTCEDALLLSGLLSSLEPKDWSYKVNQTRTAIVIADNGDRYSIKWDLKRIRTMDMATLKKMVQERKEAEPFARFRAMYAIELQQKLLADLGRIGPPANPPGTFPVSLSFFHVDENFKARPLVVEGAANAVCYVGRDVRADPVHRLVLNEQVCDAVQKAVKGLKDERVHQTAKASLKALQADTDFFARLERGEMEVPPPGAGARAIKQPGTNIPEAVFFRNAGVADGEDVAGGDARKSALLVKITDIDEV